jgi:hypothetical protein
LFSLQGFRCEKKYTGKPLFSLQGMWGTIMFHHWIVNSKQTIQKGKIIARFVGYFSYDFFLLL